VLRVDRLLVVGSGLAAYALAFSERGIYELVESATAFGTAGIFIITVFGLWGRFGGRASAYAALGVGVTTYAAGEYGRLIPHPYLAALAGAFLAFVAIGLAGSRPVSRPDRPTER
jgi:Na+/proline symporter